MNAFLTMKKNKEIPEINELLIINDVGEQMFLVLGEPKQEQIEKEEIQFYYEDIFCMKENSKQSKFESSSLCLSDLSGIKVLCPITHTNAKNCDSEIIRLKIINGFNTVSFEGAEISIKKDKVEFFATKAARCFLDFLTTVEVSLSRDEKIKMIEAIALSAKGYFENIKSPHSLETEEDNYAADVLEVLEDLLTARNIYVPDPERTGDESEGCLYGETYDALRDEIAEYFVDPDDEFLSFLKAKRLIEKFCNKEYDSEADFSNLFEVSIGYTTVTDKELEIQIYVNLVELCIERDLSGKLFEKREYESLVDLIKHELEHLYFGDLIYITAEIAEEWEKEIE